MTLLRRAVAASLLAVAFGCAGVVRPPDPAAVQRAAAAATYTASMRVSLDGPELRARTRALVGFERPDAVRVEIPGPTGARLVAVARAGRLTAVFPSEHAVYQGDAGPHAFESLLGIALAPPEMMDVLVGVPSPRLRAYEARWGAVAPREIRATLPDGARLRLTIEAPELGAPIPPAAFEPPAAVGYRLVGADEARRLWSRR